jgi:ABC-type sugar transport system ATPase subunit
MMAENRLEQLGELLELYQEPATPFVASFVGDPPMSLVAALLADQDGDLALALADGRLSLPRALWSAAGGAPVREVLLGLGPGQVSLAAETDDGALCASIYARETIGR